MTELDTANEPKNPKVALAFGVADHLVINAFAKWPSSEAIEFDVWSKEGPDLRFACFSASFTPDTFSTLTAMPLVVLNAQLQTSKHKRLQVYLDVPEGLSKLRRTPHYLEDERANQPFDPEHFFVLIVDRLSDVSLAVDTVSNRSTVTFTLVAKYSDPLRVVIQAQKPNDATQLFESLLRNQRVPLVALTVLSIEDGVLMAELRTDRSAIVNLDNGLLELAKLRKPVTETIKAA